MPSALGIQQFERRLVELGCPAAQLRRRVQELADHHEDLKQAAREEGLSEAETTYKRVSSSIQAACSGWGGASQRTARFPLTAVWLLAVLLVSNGIAAPASKAQEPPKLAPALSAPVETVAAKPPWGRIVMVGASASAGFTESEPLGGPNTPQYRLSRYVDAAVLVPHEPVRNLANVLFFMQPEAAGRQQIDQVLQAKPTLVVGLDFLFWFCYGDGRTDEERLQRFEQGLKLLEAVRCPLVVGDIPDASGASNNMLDSEQIPSARALAAANRRLKQWAAARKQVAIVPLSGFMRAVAANQALTIHGHTVPAGKTRTLLQSDQLHPSASGAVVLALSSLDAFLSTCSGFSAGEIRWDLKEVLRLGLHPAQRPLDKPAEQRARAVPIGKK